MLRKGIKFNPAIFTDGYKTGHIHMYHPGTEVVYSNYTCRSIKYMPEKANKVAVAGVQLVMQYIDEFWYDNFFSQDKDYVISQAQKYLSMYLGTTYDVSHFEALYDLGYLPIEVKALPEGTVTDAGIPLFTIKNTLPQFFWITNFLETLISTLSWKIIHSASLILAYKELLTKYALKTDPNGLWLVDYQIHDFSMRGMQAPDAAVHSAVGFAMLSKGSDTVPVMQALEHYYHADTSVFSVNATEHSVMCSGSKEGELETFRRLMKTFPTGILSVVSDTWDLWKVLTEYLPILKDEILARDGKLVIRPDSGDPVDIICGVNPSFGYMGDTDICQNKGLVELLWDTFGGTINEQGYKVLNPHIGAIYGDSITLERAEEICKRLEAKGFASTNIVLGVGSYSMGYATRDNQGGAVKSTYVKIDGVDVPIFKDPVTDDGTKKSAKGLLKVVKSVDVSTNSYTYLLLDEVDWNDESNGSLVRIYKDGEFSKRVSLDTIRGKFDTYINNKLMINGQ